MSATEFSIFLVSKGLIDRSNSKFKSIMGWQDEELFHKPFSTLIPPDAHGRLDKLLEQDEGLLAQVTFPRIPLRVKSGGFINFDMKIEIRDGGERRLDFFKPGQADGASDGPSEGDDGATDTEGFFDFVEALLASPYDGDIEVTMVSVEALRAKAGAGLSEADKEAVGKEIEAKLQGMAVGGKVGKLDEASYGLVTAGDFDEEAFQAELGEVAKRLNIAADALSAESANIKVDDRDIDPDKLRQALSHSRGVFVGELAGDVEEFASLSDVLDGIEHNRKLVADALDEHKFLSSPRLVMDNLKTISIGNLQQGMVNLEGRIQSPDSLIVMADHPDISLRHDLLQLERLIKIRVGKSLYEREKADYYELCRSTMIQPAFVKDLGALMKKLGEEPANVGFRVKGLPPVKVGGPHWDALNQMSKAGHPLWIDRFGDAVIDPGAFGCLNDGYIEMPVDMMRKLATHPDGEELMTKLITTWEAMNVRVIAADLPTYELKTLAQKLGITCSLEDPIEDTPIGG